MKPPFVRNIWLSLLVSICSLSIIAATVQQRHEHQGILQPYDDAPPKFAFNKADKRSLERGRVVYRQLKIPNGKRNVIVIRVNAPSDVVWSVISDFEFYPQWIKGMKSTGVYQNEGNHIFVKFTAKHWLTGEITWYVDHDYPQDDRDWGTWKLDYNFRSDLDDSVGFWRVKPVAGELSKSDVIYSADLRLKGWFPSFIKSIIVKKELKSATRWVKVQAEKRFNNTVISTSSNSK